MADKIAKNFVFVIAIAITWFVISGGDPAKVTFERLLGGIIAAALSAWVIYLRHDRGRRR